MNTTATKSELRTPKDERGPNTEGRRFIRILATLFLLPASGFLLPSTHAVIPEPDNVLYGTIALNQVPVTAARTDVVIEARRTTDGPAVASYRMGSNPALGSFYSLRIAVETLTPVSDGNSSEVSDSLFIVVTDGTGIRAQTSYTVAERGSVQRVDFGVVATDGDGDGLPDAWELLHFAALDRSGSSPAAGGQTVLEAFTAGSDPNDPDDAFRLSLTNQNGQLVVSFVARRAEGIGYEGMTRYYALESNADVEASLWPALTGYDQVPGNNQVVTYQSSLADPFQLYRGRVWLQTSGVAGDTDSDGLPDAWETQQFGSLGQSGDSPCANGQTALQSYTAGTNPNDANSVFKLSLTASNSQQTVSFLARKVEGAGYEGKTRRYTLEAANDPGGIWQAVPGYSGVVGNNQTTTFQAPITPTPAFYRAQVTLTP